MKVRSRMSWAPRWRVLLAVGLLASNAFVARADDIGAIPTKLTAYPKVFLNKIVGLLIRDTQAGISKGAGTDVGDISARLDIHWDTTSVGFLMPAGASDGTAGWLKNDEKGAIYRNSAAGFGPEGSVKLAKIVSGRLVKVIMSGPGDVGSIGYHDSPPAGPVSVCFTIVNGGDQQRIGSMWPPGSCQFTQQLDGFTWKLRCTSAGQPDPTCSAAF